MKNRNENNLTRHVLNKLSNNSVKRALSNFHTHSSKNLITVATTDLKVFETVSQPSLQDKTPTGRKIYSKNLIGRNSQANEKRSLVLFEPIVQKYSDLNYHIPAFTSNLFTSSLLTMTVSETERYCARPKGNIDEMRKEMKYLSSLEKYIFNKDDSHQTKKGNLDALISTDLVKLSSNKTKKLVYNRNQVNRMVSTYSLDGKTKTELQNYMLTLMKENEPKRKYLREMLKMRKTCTKKETQSSRKKMKSCAKSDPHINLGIKPRNTFDNIKASALHVADEVESNINRNASSKDQICMKDPVKFKLRTQSSLKTFCSYHMDVKQPKDDIHIVKNQDNDFHTISANKSPIASVMKTIRDQNKFHTISIETPKIIIDIVPKQVDCISSSKGSAQKTNKYSPFSSMNFQFKDQGIKRKSLILSKNFQRKTSILHKQDNEHIKSKFTFNKRRESTALNSTNSIVLLSSEAGFNNAESISVDSHHSRNSKIFKAETKEQILTSKSNQTARKIISCIKKNKLSDKPKPRIENLAASPVIPNFNKSKSERAIEIEKINDIIKNSNIRDELVSSKIKDYFAAYKPNSTIDFFDKG